MSSTFSRNFLRIMIDCLIKVYRCILCLVVIVLINLGGTTIAHNDFTGFRVIDIVLNIILMVWFIRCVAGQLLMTSEMAVVFCGFNNFKMAFLDWFHTSKRLILFAFAVWRWWSFKIWGAFLIVELTLSADEFCVYVATGSWLCSVSGRVA